MNKFLKGLSVFGLSLAAGAVMLSTASAQEAVIRFNKWTEVTGIGDESNFVRIGNKDGGDIADVCENGQTVNVWMYVHNGTSEELNGTNYDGPGVAHNTTLNVNASNGLNTYANSHTITGVVSADNAASVSDTVTINCGDKQIALKYNGVIDTSTTNPSADFKVIGDPINGARLGFDGDMPGCWDYRVSVVVQFEIVEQPEEKDFTLYCQVLELTKVVGKEDAYRIEVQAGAEPNDAATISGSVINITGPNSYAAQFDGLVIDDYTFPSVSGEYRINGTVTFTIADGYNQEANNEVTCARVIKKTVKQPPEVPEQPIDELPNTGAGTNIALFAAVVAAGTFAYRAYVARRQ